MAPRPLPRALVLLAATAVLLSACAPAVPTVDGVVVAAPVIDPSDPPTEFPYGSGMLDVFDDTAELVPGISPLRAEVEATDAAFGSQVLADAGGDPDQPVALPAAPPRSARGFARSADDDVAMGAFLLGGFAGML